ncbi:protein FAM187B [Tiliqua scincoides]|uniref:protein FAM187B n=1 Tax=Tiliqua scincoides TaxID=71010 RepID=UPI003463066F
MSTWAAAVGLLLGLTWTVAEVTVYDGHSLGSQCLQGQPCTLAFISDNPVSLPCPHSLNQAFVSWQYLNPTWANAQPVTLMLSRNPFRPLLSRGELRRLQLKSQLIAGNLHIPSPSVEDSGVYTCRVGDATVAYYDIDFQDAESIHVSHADLGEDTLGNSTVGLENGTWVELFTAWNAWQPCNHCYNPGERKRVGFCYALVTRKDQQVEPPLPCGMVRRKYPSLPPRGPELRVETCQAPCDGAPQTKMVSLLVYTTYHPQLKSFAFLRCPTSSIYSPVYWRKGPRALTHLEFLQKNGSQSLDKATGGSILRLSFQNHSHSTVYQCYVNGHLVGKFLVAAPSTLSPPGELTHSYSIIEALVVGLSMFLVFLMFLSIIQSCRRKPATSTV